MLENLAEIFFQPCQALTPPKTLQAQYNKRYDSPAAVLSDQSLFIAGGEDFFLGGSLDFRRKKGGSVVTENLTRGDH